MIRSLFLAQAQQSAARELEFAGRPEGWALFAAIVALVGVCAAAFTLYRREHRAGASPALRMFLAVMRSSAYAALALVLIEPVIATYRSVTRNGLVAVAYDVSASMDMAQPDAGTSAGPSTRISAVRDLLGRANGAWLNELAKQNTLRLFAFGDGVRPIEWPPPVATSDEDRFAAPPELRLRTDCAAAVSGALEALPEGPVAALILLSDGVSTRGPGVEAAIAAAESRKARVFTIGLGPEAEPVNLRIVDILAPTTTPLGDPFEVRVEVQSAGLADAVEVDVELFQTAISGAAAASQASGGAMDPQRIAERRVQLAADGSSTSLVFDVTPSAAGEFAFRARVSPRDDEVTRIDNERETLVQVLEQRYRVLLVSGRPSYEYRFLTRLLERDKNVSVSCWLQSADETAIRDGDAPLTALPRTADELFAYDVILLLDPFVGEVDANWAALVRRWIDEFRGGLLFAAGSHFSPRFLNDERARALVSVLPVAPDPEAELRLSESGTYRETMSPLIVPVDAVANPLLAVGAAPEANAAFWRAMPGVWWTMPVEDAKPAAAVLLRRAASAGRPPESGSVLFATHTFGGGRVAFLGFDSTWRWRGPAEEAYTRFWVQLIRYLAQGRRSDSDPRVTIQLDRETVNVGEYVSVEVRLLDPQFVPWFEPQIEIELFSGDGPPRAVVLPALPDRPGWFGARVLFDRFGTTTLRVRAPGGAATASSPASEPKVVSRTVRVQQPDVELRVLRQDAAFLRELARATGGRYMTPAEAEKLPELIANATETSVTRDPAPEPLWDRAWVLFSIAGVLALEWTIRRRNYLL